METRIMYVLFGLVSALVCVDGNRLARLERLVQLLAGRMDTDSISREQAMERLLEKLDFLEMKLNETQENVGPTVKCQPCEAPSDKLGIKEMLMGAVQAIKHEKENNHEMRQTLPRLLMEFDEMRGNISGTIGEMTNSMCRSLNGRTMDMFTPLKAGLSEQFNTLASWMQNISTRVDMMANEVIKCQENIKVQLASSTKKQGQQTTTAVTSALQTTVPTTPGHDLVDSCLALYEGGVRKSGVYRLLPAPGADPVEAYCDMVTDGGGWTVFQRRQDGSEDFLRNWVDYENGFGDLKGEFWLGNIAISQLTTPCCRQLRVDLRNTSGDIGFYAKYSKFQVLPSAAKYKLVVDGYSGNAVDRLRYHNGMMFSTVDQDNDEHRGNCASEVSHGAWWYKNCDHSNLNTKWTPNKGVNWGPNKYIFTEMKLK